MTTTYLITGASRGLGLETARQLLASSPSVRVLAAARDPAKATALQALVQKEPERIATITLDVSNIESIKSGVEEASKHPFAKEGIDVLWNNAGVVGGGGLKSPLQSTLKDLNDALQVNLFGTIAVTSEAMPLLRTGKGKKIISTSSIVGSIGGPMTSMPVAATYAISKAAVNMWSVKLARELDAEKFTVLVFHPGYVKTDMTGGDDGPANISPEESVQKSLSVLLPTSREDNGKFLNFTGEVLPW